MLILCIIFILSGCSNTEQVQEPFTPPVTLPAETQSVNGSELLAVSVPAVTENYALEDGTEIFSYTAQHMQLILPNEDVADKVVLDFLNRVDASQTEADRILTAAQLDYDPNTSWFPYFYQIVYSPTRIDSGVLSLFGTQNGYSGGMHGGLSGIAANYDLVTGDVLTLGSIMHMDATVEDFISLVIEKLDAVKDDYYLFDDYAEGVRSRMNGDENLYEDFYFTGTGLCFFFSPYEIAPYASGMISVEIPYSELPGLIYDGYFPDEREEINGTMQVGSFMKTDMEQFDNMAELTFTTGEEIMVAYPAGMVEDIRVIIPGDGMIMPDYTAFAAFAMADKDALVVNIGENQLEGVTVSYYSAGEIHTIPFH